MKKHALFRLCANPNKDAVATALRLILIRTVEILSKESKLAREGEPSHTVSTTDSPSRRQKAFCLAMSLFAEVVDAVRCSVTPVQLASLLLGVGRQIEPHCFHCLFPLPPSIEAHRDETIVTRTPNKVSPKYVVSKLHSYEWRTVEDLYSAAVRNGSLSISSSALPLCSSKPSTHEKCNELLHHCLESLETNTASDSSILFDTSGEARLLLRDLFRFGVKLEDADPGTVHCTSGMGIDNGQEQRIEPGEHVIQSDNPTDDDVPPEEKVHHSIPKVVDKRSSSSVLRLFLPFLWSRESKKKHLEEQAIYEAASLFILSGFEDNDVGYLNPFEDAKTTSSTVVQHSEQSSAGIIQTNDISVAGTISRYLLSGAFNAKDAGLSHWRKSFIIARLAMGENPKLFRPSSAEVDTCRKLSGQVLLNELAGELRCYADISRRMSFVTVANGLSEDERLVVSFLAFEIAECENELNRSEASVLINLVLLLLSRHKHCADVQSVIPGLVILGVAAGSVAGRMKDVLDVSEHSSSDMKRCYVLATRELAIKVSD